MAEIEKKEEKEHVIGEVAIFETYSKKDGISIKSDQMFQIFIVSRK
jgi:hypothetical protein